MEKNKKLIRANVLYLLVLQVVGLITTVVGLCHRVTLA